MDTQAEHNIFINGNWQWIRALKNHTHGLAQLDEGYVIVVNIFAKDVDHTLGANVSVALVHAIEAAEESGFTAPAGADQAGDHTISNAGGYTIQRLKIAVPKAQALRYNCMFALSTHRRITQNLHSQMHWSWAV